MAIVQSEWGALRKMVPVSRESGGVVAEKYKFVITKDLAANDIIELAVLPAYHTIVDAILITDEVGAATFNVGIMSGAVGSPDQARTSGTELFIAATDFAVTRMVNPVGFRVTPVEGDRSIGVKVLGSGITQTGQVIELILFTKQ
ncbi:hypothetical protein D3C87_1235240 [compost metagenome]